MRLKPKVKESGELVFIRNNNKASKGREGWELQNFRMVEVFQLGNRPFIVRVLSQGKPMKHTVLLNRKYT